MPEHNDDDPVMVGYSSSRNITFNSRNGADELGITWGDWRRMSDDEKSEALAEYTSELVDVWVEDDEQ